MFKSAANKITHNTLITAITGHGESKFLHELIVAEKAVLTSYARICFWYRLTHSTFFRSNSIQRLSADLQKSAEALKAWGLNEAGDLGVSSFLFLHALQGVSFALLTVPLPQDVLSGSLELLSLFSSALSRYATHEHTVREHMKAIRSREEQFFKLQRFQQSMVDKDELTAKKLEKLRAEDIALHEMSQEHARLRQLREAMQVSEAKIRTDGAELRNFKRKATKRWMLIKFGGLVEFSEVGTVNFALCVQYFIPEHALSRSLGRLASS